MGDTEHSGAPLEGVRLALLHQETQDALVRSARRNGRTMHEEAEHIIRTHLAENEDGQA